MTRKLRDTGFSIYLADPSKLTLIFNMEEKICCEDSYALVKSLRLDEPHEVHLPSEHSDYLKSLAKYGTAVLVSIIIMKKPVHAILASGDTSILRSVNNLSTAQRCKGPCD